MPNPVLPPPIAPCKLTGEYVVEGRRLWNVDVILTGECCGGEPGGLFVCFSKEPDAGSSSPPR